MNPSEYSAESEESRVQAILQAATPKLRRAKTARNIAIAAYVTMGLPYIILRLFFGLRPSGSWVPFVPLLIIYGFAAVTLLTVRTSRLVVTSLTELTDVRSIPPLLDAVATMSARELNVVYVALKRLLPVLTESDSRFFASSHLKSLRSLLTKRGAWLGWQVPDRELKVAVIQALKVLGDSSSIPIVTRLADSRKKDAVQQAAAECLPILEARSAAQKEHGPLLRPVNASPSEAGSLLRPVAHVEPDLEEQLLRPIERQGSA